MPEIIELKIASDFVNTKSDLTFNRVGFSKVTKNPTDIIPNDFGDFKIRSTTRGKEMKLILSGKSEISLIFQFGMSGNWKWVDEDLLDKEKHHHFRLHTGNKVLTFWDPRRFGGWRLGDWSKDRGPDPIKEFELFKQNLTNSKGRWKSKPIFEVMLDQSIFNGIGNYLRSEIISRAGINPFVTWNDLNNNERDLITSLCRSIPLEVEDLGGGQLRDWDNPDGIDSGKFNNWLKCYSKEKSILDKNGRRFWFDSKWFGYLSKKS
jgi:formamidopyrimidine-DNA glycosylase